MLGEKTVDRRQDRRWATAGASSKNVFFHFDRTFDDF